MLFAWLEYTQAIPSEAFSYGQRTHDSARGLLEGIYERNTMLNSNLNHKTCHALISCFKHIVTIWPGWAHQTKQVPSRLVRSPSDLFHTRSPY